MNIPTCPRLRDNLRILAGKARCPSPAREQARASEVICSRLAGGRGELQPPPTERAPLQIPAIYGGCPWKTNFEDAGSLGP